MIAKKNGDSRQGEARCNNPGNCPSPPAYDALRRRGACVALTSGGERRLPPLTPTVALPGSPFRHGTITSKTWLSAASFAPTTARHDTRPAAPPRMGILSLDGPSGRIAFCHHRGVDSAAAIGTRRLYVAQSTAKSATPHWWRSGTIGLATGHKAHLALSLRPRVRNADRDEEVGGRCTSVHVVYLPARPCLKAKVPSSRCRSVQTGRTAQ